MSDVPRAFIRFCREHGWQSGLTTCRTPTNTCAGNTCKKSDRIGLFVSREFEERLSSLYRKDDDD